MFTLKPLNDPTPVQALKEAYLSSLVFPMDSYWQGAVLGLAAHWQIDVNEQQAGYCVISKDKSVLQFYVSDPFLALAADLFSFIVNGDQVESASAGTFEPIYLAHCLDHQNGIEIRSYLFADHRQIEPHLASYPDAQFRPATNADAENLATFYSQNDEYEDTETIEAGFGGRLNYAKTLIAEGQVFILIDKNELLATGECRISANQRPYADLGMITGKAFRRRGIGVYMLAKMKEYCTQRGAQPICSCAAENLPSRKAIEKAGFVVRHRLLNISFD